MDMTDPTFPVHLHIMAFARSDSDPRTPGVLNYVGDIFWKRYKAGCSAGDLDGAISTYGRSVRLTPDFDPEQGMCLVNLGVALYTRFQKKGNRSDIDMACFCFEGSLLSEPCGSRAFRCMGNLGAALMERFGHTRYISDLTRAVSILRQAVNLTADGHPDHPSYLTNLGISFELQFKYLGNISDLEMAVSAKQQAVELTPDGNPAKPSRLKNLSNTLKIRFDSLGDVSDLEMAVSADQQAVKLTTDGHPDKPSYLENLGNDLEVRFNHLGDISDLERAISFKRQAAELTPDGHPDKPRSLNNLGTALKMRFDCFGNVSDLEMAISVSRQAVKLTPDGHAAQPSYLSNLSTALKTRFDRLGDVSDLEMAISVGRHAMDLTPDGDPNKPGHLNNLGNNLETRFNLRNISDLELAISSKQQAVKLSSDGEPEKPRRLNNLGTVLKARFDCFGDMSDLEMAISVTQQAIELTPDGHTDKPGYLHNLSNAFQTRFGRLGDVSDLQSAVTTQKRCVDSTPDEHNDRPDHLTNLTRALVLRYRHIGNVSDLEMAVDTISTAAQFVAGRPRTKFDAARRWSELSEMVNDEQQMLRAYDCAIALIPRVAWMGLTIEGRHRELPRIGDLVRKAAAASVRAEDPDRALRWLEQGRSVVWGQSLQQRSPLDLLKERDSARAGRLAEISRALESNAKDAVLTAERRGDQLHALVLEWDALILEVREQEGFEDFLGPKDVTQLLKAASSFPVVVLNVHEAGCDALVLIAEADGVIHIPLGLNFQRAQELLDTLDTIKSRHSRGRSIAPADRGFRIVGSENYDPDKIIKGLLAELWTGVVKPVLDALAFSLPDDDGDLPRICWCPTGPMAFLPIHAAGLYDTNARGTKVFEFAVSSYTPTVSALLRAPTPNPTRPKIFAVAQAKHTKNGFSALPSTRKEIQLIGQRAAENSVDFIVAEDGAGTVKRVLDEMSRCHWVHLACHGTQDLDHPTKSAFVLADGSLELSEIIKHPLPQGEFAFLSACQTATGDVKLAEEAVHLAAGMMLAGYRSVIATMWSILDKDAPGVADAVYAEMLKDGGADASRAAHALHRAVDNLRSSGAPLLAWMPFIHMGR